MSDTSVTATARAYFRGEPGEGDEGMVKPGDKLTLTRDRAAQLRANGLIDGDGDPGAAAAGGAAATAAPAAPAAASAKVEPITTASVAKPAARPKPRSKGPRT
jgi:hypothetical protein